MSGRITKCSAVPKKLLAAFCCFITSAAAISQTDFYIPKALIIPVHENRHELHASLGVGGGADLNLSFALTDRFAVFTTVTLNKGKDDRRSIFGNAYSIRKDDYALTGGLGYFKNNSGTFLNHFETLIGLGKYKVDNFQYFPGERDTRGYKTDAAYWSVYGQVNAIHKVRKHEFAIALRVSYSTYRQLEWLKKDPILTYEKEYFEGLKALSFDPVLSYSYLYRKVKFNAQVGLSTSPNTVTDQTDTGTRGLGLSAFIARFSIQYNFNLKKKLK